MKSKRIKSICHIIVFWMFLISSFRLLQFSDLPNFFNLDFMIRPEVIPDIELSLYTSFVVTAVFYLFMNYVPEKIIEKEAFPYKCNMYTDIRRFLVDILIFWGGAYKHVKYPVSVNEKNTISEIIEKDAVLDVASKLKMADGIGMNDGFGNEIKWAKILHSFLNKMVSSGENILEKYSKDLPPGIYRDIDYLINESPLFGKMKTIYGTVFRTKKKDAVLLDCIKTDSDDDIDKTIKCMNNIFCWLNKTRDELGKENKKNKETSIDISKVNLTLYFM